MKKQKIIVIVGPTASGKSNLAVTLAQKYKGEIISADSRQIYKGLDKGTGKITKKEMRGIPHHLLDVWNPRKQVSVDDFVKKAHKALKKIERNKKIPIVCGGTGFYIDSFIRGALYPKVPPDKKLRRGLAGKNAHELFLMLKKINPSQVQQIDRYNPVRLIRAIEITRHLGTIPKIKYESPFDTLFIGIDIGTTQLRKNINARLKKRLAQGMVGEAKKLHTRGLSFARMESLGLEYKYLALYLQKKINIKKLQEQLAHAIWQYSRRQMTWFRKNKDIHWLTPSPYHLKKMDQKISTFLSH